MPLRFVRYVAAATALLLTVSCSTTSEPGSGPAPASLIIVSGDAQTGSVMGALPNDIVVLVTDSLGASLAGVTVRFLVTSGGGDVSPDSAVTDVNGLAQTSWTLGLASGTQSMTARVAKPGGLLLATATALARVPASLQVVGGGAQTGGKSSQLPAAIRLVVTDSTLAPVGGVIVTFVAANGGSVSDDSVAADGLGQAATSWTLGPGAGPQTLLASVTRPGRSTLTVTVDATALNLTRALVSGRPYGLALGANGRVYATRLDAGSLAVASLTTRTVTGSVSVGFTPTGVTLNPAQTEAYVTNQLSHNVGVVNVATNTQVAVIPVPNDPFVVAFAPSGAQAYVATNVGMVYAINTASRAVVDSVFTGNGSNGLAISADATTLYVSAFAAGRVYEVSLATFDTTRSFAAGGSPQGMAVSVDGTELYVVNEFPSRVEVWNLAAGTMTTSVAMPAGGGFGLALSPNGATLYATVNGRVIVIDRQTRAIVDNIFTGGDPRRLAVSANGQTVVVANQSGWIDFIP